MFCLPRHSPVLSNTVGLIEGQEYQVQVIQFGFTLQTVLQQHFHLTFVSHTGSFSAESLFKYSYIFIFKEPEISKYIGKYRHFLSCLFVPLSHFILTFYLHGQVCTAAQEGCVHIACQSQIAWASGYLPLSCPWDWQWSLLERWIQIFGLFLE